MLRVIKKSIAVLLSLITLWSATILVASAESAKATNDFSEFMFELEDAERTIPRFFLYEYNGNIVSVVANPYTMEIVATTYSNDFNIVSQKNIIAEGNYFGGFYSGSKYNYMVFGHKNDEEDFEKEVFRIVKYDKNFNRIDKLSIIGSQCHTYMPFVAGDCRMDEFGSELTVHTCRQYFTTPDDGLRHQAQFTIVIDTETMRIKNELGFFQDNHVSHSFDQFVRYDQGKRVLLDHGDAYPRSIYLQKYVGLGSSGFSEVYSDVNLFNFTGEIGENYTGASLFGFEVSENNYIVAISTVDQEDKVSETRRCSDAVLLVCNKGKLSDENVKHVYLTDYIPENKRVGYMSLVKLSENRFAVLWEECNNYSYYDDRNIIATNYVIVNENGKAVTPVKKFNNMELSACSQPLFYNNKLIWCYQDRNDGNKAVIVTLDIAKDLNCEHSIVRAYSRKESCTAVGNREYYKCEICGEIYTDSKGVNKVTLNDVLIPMLPHQGGKPTCSNPGKCTVCKETYIKRESCAYGDWIVTEEPTCTTKGMKWQHCANCGGGTGFPIPATHTIEDYTVITPPTCTKDGLGKGTCTVCGEITENYVIPATGHVSSGKWVNEKASTCMKWGSKEMRCSVCDDLLTEVPIEPTGHAESEWITVSIPSEGKTGERIKYCSDCSKVIAREAIPETDSYDKLCSGHKVSSEWTIVVPATCKTVGIRSKKCTVCQQYIQSENISAQGHSMKWIVIRPATCLEGTKEAYMCEQCGYYTSTATYNDKISCIAGDWEVVKTATCSTEGEMVRKCTMCSRLMYSSTIPVTDHRESEWIIEKLPTCGQAGSKKTVCNDCGVVIENQIIPATGEHIFDSERVVASATCTSNGLKVKHCKICSLDYEETIAPLGHVVGPWEIIKDATATTQGEKVKKCSRCGDVVEREIIPAIGTFSIIYNANGGNVSPASIDVEKGKSTTLPTPTKTVQITYNANGGSGAPSAQSCNLDCDGWAISSSATSASYSCGASYKPTKNVTLYAVWLKTTITLKSTVPTRSGYKFLGWSKSSNPTSASYTSGSSITLNSDVTLYAVWEKIPTVEYYTVNYYANGGNVSPASIDVEKGKSTTLPTPTKTVQITYNANGGSGAPSAQSCNLDCDGWATTSSATTGAYSCGSSYKPTKDSNLYAVWLKTTVNLKSTVPTRSGYTFLGWSKYSNATSPSYYPGDYIELTKNTTLYAVWEEIPEVTYTITYNANGGSGAPSAQTGSTVYIISSKIPTRNGYEFIGWSMNKNATTGVYMPGDYLTLTGNITLYAIWEKEVGVVNDVNVADLALNYKEMVALSVDVGGTDDYEIEYESSNTNVATVDKNGYVTGTGIGAAEITVTVTDEYGNVVEETCTVTVSYAWWQWIIVIVLFGWIWY